MEETAATLPDDVVLEVLARVADIAALFRCAMTCMRWRGLIADRSFLRRHWPENATHPSFLVGFFTQRQRYHGFEGNEEWPFPHDDVNVADCDSPPVFIPAPRSVLGPGLRSLPDGVLDGAKPLTARRGLLLVHLAPVLDRGPVRLALCDLLAGTCDMLPLLQLDHEYSSTSYAILTPEDCGSSEPRTPARGYCRFFKVLAMNFFRDIYHGRGVVEYSYNLHTFSSAEPGWAAPAKRLGDHRRCDGPQYSPDVQGDAVVCRGGTTHWLCGNWFAEDRRDPANYFTIDASPEDDHISMANLTFMPIHVRPAAENCHLATVNGELMLYLLYTLKQGLWLDTWTRRDGAYWYRDRVIELKPPEKMRIHDEAPYLWSGEKSGTLLIIDSNWCKYVACLETGAVEEISSQFHGMVRDAVVPMEIVWPDLFMSRLAGALPDNRT